MLSDLGGGLFLGLLLEVVMAIFISTNKHTALRGKESFQTQWDRGQQNPEPFWLKAVLAEGWCHIDFQANAW